MINKLPVIGWFFSVLGSVSMAVPFYICWTLCGIGEKYFYFLPDVYRAIDFWDCVGLFIVGSILLGFVPKFASVSQSNKNGD